MKPFFRFSLALLVALPVSAIAGYHRFEQNMKPAPGSQQVIAEYQQIGTPVAVSATLVHAAVNNPSTSVPMNVTTGLTSPDVPRNLTVTTGGTAGDCAAGNVIVSGTDAFGKSLTESLAITSGQSGATTGVKAFRTVTAVTLPAEQTTHACTFSVGVGNKLGLNRCLNQVGDIGHATFGGVKETTAPTIAASATAVSGNTVTLNSAVDGGHAVQVLYYQNYRCIP